MRTPLTILFALVPAVVAAQTSDPAVATPSQIQTRAFVPARTMPALDATIGLGLMRYAGNDPSPSCGAGSTACRSARTTGVGATMAVTTRLSPRKGFTVELSGDVADTGSSLGAFTAGPRRVFPVAPNAQLYGQVLAGPSWSSALGGGFVVQAGGGARFDRPSRRDGFREVRGVEVSYRRILGSASNRSGLRAMVYIGFSSGNRR